MRREVYIKDALPNKAKKSSLCGYRSEASMTTITTAKRSGMKQDMSEVVGDNCKAKDHYAS